MNHKLDELTDAIKKNFKNGKNQYEAHLRSHEVMKMMAADDEVAHEIFRRAIVSPNFLEKKYCSQDITNVIIDEPEVFMFASYFGPNKEKRTDLSYSTMHTHGDHLLSTINAKGDGYKQLIFKKGFEISDDRGQEVNIELSKYVHNVEGNIEFMDADVAHTLFYPSSLQMSYALFSPYYTVSTPTKLKKNPIIQKNKELIKKALKKFHLKPQALNVTQYFEDYFYPQNGKMYHLDGQVNPVLRNDHYIQNFFHTAKEFMGFDDRKFLKSTFSSMYRDNKSFNKDWMEKAIENEYIPRSCEVVDTITPMRNVHIDEYRKLYSF